MSANLISYNQFISTSKSSSFPSIVRISGASAGKKFVLLYYDGNLRKLFCNTEKCVADEAISHRADVTRRHEAHLSLCLPILSRRGPWSSPDRKRREPCTKLYAVCEF